VTQPDLAPTPYYDPETQAARMLVMELSNGLDRRIGDVLRLQRYYDGHQPLKFATVEYRKHFGRQYSGFHDNWCAPVVDTTAEKLTVAGLRLGDARDTLDDASGSDIARTADRDFARIWNANDGAQESSQAFIEACIARRSFALVWGNGDDEQTPEITFESPDEVIVGYEPGSRRKRKAALKRWTDGDCDFATLYLPDALWKWQRRRPQSSKKLWTPDEVDRYAWLIRDMPGGAPARIPNPSGVVPMVELANRPRLRSEPLSEVEGAAAMQDAINALWSYLFTAADFAAMPQRVLLGATAPKIPVLDADGKPTGAMKDVPVNEWLKPAAMSRMMSFEGDAKIAQWDPSNLETFTKAIEFAVGHLAAQSRTPAHYFTGNIQNISADGLTGLAQAHISKVRERAVYHSLAIKEIAAVSYLMLGDRPKAAAARAGRVMWEDFELRSEGQMADLAIKMRQSGFSFEYVAQKFIADPVELAEEIERHNIEEAAKAAAMEFGPKTDQMPSPDEQQGDGPAEDDPYAGS
jgi:hypothetical protein